MTEDVKDQQPSELDMLKQRANQLGLKYHHNIGVEKLKAIVNAKLKPVEEDKPSVQHTRTLSPNPSKGKESGELTAIQKEFRAAKSYPVKNEANMTDKEKASRQVRIRISCFNPNKTEWEGEIFTVGNSVMGFKKYVPFNNDEGWHVPHMIYDMIKARKCQIFFNQKDDKGNITRASRLINEFAVEVLPPLTNKEFVELGQRQAMASGTAQ